MPETNSDVPVIDEDGPSDSIPEFCIKENISPSTYYKMKRLGHGPEETHLPGTSVIRITPEARRKWHKHLAKLATGAAARLEQQRRVALASAAGKKAAASEKHVSKRGPRNRTTP